MLRPSYPLLTERLVIRPFTEDDLDDVLAYRSLDSVTRYVPWDVSEREETRALLRRFAARTELFEEGSITLAIELSGTVIGESVIFWRSREHRQGELGYVLNPSYNGHGYATEAAREMLRLGFDESGLHRMIGRIDARNIASARVLERLGMRLEANFRENEYVKGEWTDEKVYAMLHSEWDAGAGSAAHRPPNGESAVADDDGDGDGDGDDLIPTALGDDGD